MTHPDGPPEWMTYDLVEHLADGFLAKEREATALAAEVLRCWDLLETQSNQIFALKEKR